MTQPTRTTQIAVIGGGITGLACAHRLTALGIDALVLEASPSTGGKVSTIRRSGYEFEPGPNTLIANKQPMLDLIDEVGLGPEIIEGSPLARRRYVCLKGRLEPITTNPLNALTSPLLGPIALARALWDLIPRRRPMGANEESVAEFITRRFGPRIRDSLVAPFLTGVYAGNASRLEARAILARLVEAEESKGSVIRGLLAQRKAARREGRPLPMRTITFRNGLGALPTRIAQRLGSRILSNTGVTRIRTSPRGCTVETGDGAAFACNRVVIATPPHDAARLLNGIGGAEAISTGLAGIECASLAVVGLGYDRAAIAHPLDGFGYLRGPHTPGPVLGCLFRSSVFPHAAPKGKSLLTVFIGGVDFPEAAHEPDAILVNIVHDELSRRLGIRSAPEEVFTRRWIGTIPQPNRGYSRLREMVSVWSSHNPVCVVGSAITGLSLNDCVGAGRAEAERLAAALSRTVSTKEELCQSA